MATGSDRWSDHAAADVPDDSASHETVALLLDEVARLEAELRARDEALAAPPAWDAPAPGADLLLARQVEDLTVELAGRDETIAILLEQTQAFEEAADARHAEWEQLTRWVEEVERRVSERGAEPADLAERLDAERRRADDSERRRESDLRAWDAQRQRLESEADALRRHAPTAPDGSAVGLVAENQRLRAACIELEGQAAESQALRRRVDELLLEADTLRGELRRERDERAVERIEGEAALIAMRSERARTALTEPVGPVAAPAEARDPGLDPDERIRAFRQHLRELHEREAAERASRGLAGRLSRLWRHTGPG